MTTTSAPQDWNERTHRFALTVWVEPGDATLGQWLLDLEQAGHPTPVQHILTTVREHPDTLHGDRADLARRVRPRLTDTDAVEAAIRWLDDHAYSWFLTPTDPDWPSQLDDLGPYRPYGLWGTGDPTTLTRRHRTTIEGARASTAYGEHIATELTTVLVERGHAIITGAAYGIEAAATRATLAARGTPIAALAGGIDRPYPTGHTSLLERVAATGAVISEVAPKHTPTKWRFLARGRILAALAQHTVIVEAGWRSGALNTATHAVALNRFLGAVPGPITSAASAGCHRIIRELDAHLITSADDIPAADNT